MDKNWRDAWHKDDPSTWPACAKCGARCEPSGCTAGYGLTADGEPHCFACCADGDRDYMRKHGKIGLYLSRGKDGAWKVSNWPGSLTIRPSHVRTWTGQGFGGSYPVAQAWFTFDGQPWTIRIQGNMECGTARRLG